MDIELIKIGQGPAVLLDDAHTDCQDYTDPNLYRHIVSPATLDSDETGKSYKLCIGGVDSYRTTAISYRNEDPADDTQDTEIP